MSIYVKRLMNLMQETTDIKKSILFYYQIIDLFKEIKINKFRVLAKENLRRITTTYSDIYLDIQDIENGELREIRFIKQLFFW